MGANAGEEESKWALSVLSSRGKGNPKLFKDFLFIGVSAIEANYMHFQRSN